MVRLASPPSVRSSFRTPRASGRARSPALCALAVALTLGGACGSPSGNDNGGTGGAGSGNPGTGGVTPPPAGTGGAKGTGGTQGSTGGSGISNPGTGGGAAAGTGGGAVGGRGMTGAGGGSTSTGGSQGSIGGSNGAVYNPNFKEFYGDDCTVPDPKNGNVSTLDDLFLMADGSRMSKKSDWKCQRAYLKKIIEKYIHGAKPAKPATVTGTVTSTAINVHVEGSNGKIDFKVGVSNIPAGATGPVPIVIGLGAVSSLGGDTNLANTITAEGVALGNYDHQGMDSESSRTGLFTTVNGSNGVSAQVGWAWGISRVIDVLVAERDAGRNNIIDPTAVGVYGCSRNGKGAFTVGAFDERIALGIPQESGTGGVTALKMIASAPQGPNNQPAQSVASAMSTAAGWFGTVFGSYATKLNSIPGDMHSLAAMYAPRGLIVLDNSRIGELCSTCQDGASEAAKKLYEALGVGSNIGYNAGKSSDPQDHCSFNMIQVAPLQRAIRAHLTKTAAPDGRIELQSVGKADMTKWAPWTAPTLADDVSWASPPLTSK